MALTERKEIDQITINPVTGYVGWRETTIVERDGVEIARTYFRVSLEADYADFPDPPVVPPEVEPSRALAQTPDKVAQARKNRADAAKGPQPTPRKP